MITPPSILPRYGMVSEQTSQLDALMGGHYFDTPKPVEMIKDLSRWFTAGSDTIMDFFAGSGTTGQSVMELNAEDAGTRRFVLVQLPEPLDVDTAGEREAALFCDSVGALRNVASLTKERLRRAGASASEVNPAADLDAGFKSYVLADTNFAKWRLSSDVEEDALQQHLLSLRDSATDDATADELLTEILLKQGYSLTEAVSPAEVAGLDVRLVRDRDGDIAVLAYLNEHVKPTLEQLRALVDKSPTRIIVLEDAFQGDDELKTNLAQLAKSKGIELWTA